MSRTTLFYFILISYILFFSPDCFAYRIISEDTVAYSFRNGEFHGEDNKYRCVYEVNEDAGTITEISIINTDKGSQRVDLVNIATPEIYRIIKNKDGNITGVKTQAEGESIISFKEDGTYNFYLTGRINDEALSGVSFGTYTVTRDNREKFLFLEPINKLIDDDKSNDLEAQAAVSNFNISERTIEIIKSDLSGCVPYPLIIDALVNYLETVAQEGNVRESLTELKRVIDEHPDFNMLIVGQDKLASGIDSIR